MPSLRLKGCFTLILCLGVALAVAEKTLKKGAVSSLSLEDVDEKLQECAIVQELSAHKKAHAQGESAIERIFAIIFPGSPAVNSLLATLYISGPPNFLLALWPPNPSPALLSIMVAFAVGGLLGDTIFHLFSEIYVGEDDPTHARFVLVEPNRNLLLGAAILVGFMTFVALDKTLRIATGGEGHEHSHSHDHSHSHNETSAASTSVEASDKKGVKSRKKGNGSSSKGETEVAIEKEINPSVKLSGYLNMIADATHNVTDGLAMVASFYASPTIGATTAVAVMIHEIPHEVGDFALLVKAGFSKRAAMGAQFVTATGALLGTLIGIAIQEFGGSGAVEGSMPMNAGLWGTSLTWGDMLLPFTAGTFLYVGTVAVIPELLETGPNKLAEVRKTLTQFAAIAAGAGIMLYISWHD